MNNQSTFVWSLRYQLNCHCELFVSQGKFLIPTKEPQVPTPRGLEITNNNEEAAARSDFRIILLMSSTRTTRPKKKAGIKMPYPLLQKKIKKRKEQDAKQKSEVKCSCLFVFS